jgi:methylated-DNA-protein-cysteine methyltransferase-like protein
MGTIKNSNSKGIKIVSNSDKAKLEGKRPANQPGTHYFKERVNGPESDKPRRIWQVVAEIPFGKVASYGQIADLAGLQGYARYVGRTLSRLPKNTKLPWHRVVNAELKIACRDPAKMIQQRRLLEQEGISLIRGKILRVHCWQL